MSFVALQCELFLVVSFVAVHHDLFLAVLLVSVQYGCFWQRHFVTGQCELSSNVICYCASGTIYGSVICYRAM